MTLEALITKYEKELQETYKKYGTDNPYEIDNVKERTLTLAILDFTNQLKKLKENKKP